MLAPTLHIEVGGTRRKAEPIASSNFGTVFSYPFNPNWVIKIIETKPEQTEDEFNNLKLLYEKGLGPRPIKWGFLGLDERLAYIVAEKVEGVTVDKAHLTSEELELARQLIRGLIKSNIIIDDLWNLGNIMIGRIGDGALKAYVVDAGRMRISTCRGTLRMLRCAARC